MPCIRRRFAACWAPPPRPRLRWVSTATHSCARSALPARRPRVSRNGARTAPGSSACIPGRAAHAGVLAARLAREGFTGPATIFEGDGGFFRAFTHGETIDPEAMTRGLGKRLPRARHGGEALSLLPLRAWRHRCGARRRRRRHRRRRHGAVAIRIYRTNVLSYHQEPRNAVDAQFNVPYAVAVAFVRGAVRLADFTEEAIKDPAVLAFARPHRCARGSRIHSEVPAGLLRRAEGQACATAATRSFLSECPSGDPDAARYQGNPGLLQAEVEGRRCVARGVRLRRSHARRFGAASTGCRRPRRWRAHRRSRRAPGERRDDATRKRRR